MVHNGITQRGTVGKAKQKIVVLYFYKVQLKAERCFPGLLKIPTVKRG